MSVREYMIIIEKAGRNFSAYAPDLPGCVAVGDTRRQTEISMREAMAIHIEGMMEDGLPLPKPSSSVRYIEVSAPRHGAGVLSRSASARKAAGVKSRQANGRGKRP